MKGRETHGTVPPWAQVRDGKVSLTKEDDGVIMVNLVIPEHATLHQQCYRVDTVVPV